ncbi:MAG: peptidoglycan DD-metalloendopeptidase family protein [Clostridiales bacterium]|nr:peptidoglycan DD-metalloendopeptidase family protein [Clostridiales bacterium]MCF8023381.1 peptidoglycan DD-metalloendopeptidase family protein [Clostridiales bacterium]
MWPFGKKVKDQNGVKKYRRWLRRWLLGGRGRYSAAALAAVLAAGIVYTVVNAGYIGNFNKEPGLKSRPDDAKSQLTYELGSKPVDKLPGEKQGDVKNSSNDSEVAEKAEESVEKDVLTANPAIPVQGVEVSSYGFHYSPVYEDYRFHGGITFSAGAGEEVSPCLPGEVTGVTRLYGEKYKVVVEHQNGLTSIYKGLYNVAACEGDKVTPGDLLGTVNKKGTGKKGKINFLLIKNGETINPAEFFPKL